MTTYHLSIKLRYLHTISSYTIKLTNTNKLWWIRKLLKHFIRLICQWNIPVRRLCYVCLILSVTTLSFIKSENELHNMLRKNIISLGKSIITFINVRLLLSRHCVCIGECLLENLTPVLRRFVVWSNASVYHGENTWEWSAWLVLSGAKNTTGLLEWCLCLRFGILKNIGFAKCYQTYFLVTWWVTYVTYVWLSWRRLKLLIGIVNIINTSCSAKLVKEIRLHIKYSLVINSKLLALYWRARVD